MKTALCICCLLEAKNFQKLPELSQFIQTHVRSLSVFQSWKGKGKTRQHGCRNPAVGVGPHISALSLHPGTICHIPHKQKYLVQVSEPSLRLTSPWGHVTMSLCEGQGGMLQQLWVRGQGVVRTLPSSTCLKIITLTSLLLGALTIDVESSKNLKQTLLSFQIQHGSYWSQPA